MAADIRALVQRFEPLLHFHKDERFFPSDAKRYMEHSELWSAVGDLAANRGVQRTLKDNWGSSVGDHRSPLIARGAVSAEAGESGTFIGLTGTFVADDQLQERFLNLAGWRGGDIVDAGSENGYADLDKIATAYNSTPADGGDQSLSDSRFWYHAEFFTADRLRNILGFGNQGENELLNAFNKATSDPALLCYYFFFPGHEEGLTGCVSNAATSWTSCAGAWQCLAILLDRATPTDDYAPKFTVATNRSFRAVGFIGLDPRVGMTGVARWDKVSTVGDHPMIFVAKGTHGLYFADTDQTFIMSDPSDPSVKNCGVYEGIAPFDSDRGQSDGSDLDKILVTKVVAGGGFFGVIGAVAGLFASVIEGLAAASDLTIEEGTPAIDELPKGQFGRVLRPPGIDSPVAPDAPGPIWPRFNDDPADPLSTFIGGRRFSLVVGTKADPLGQTSRPAWLPSDDRTSGFRGRWGNRVTRDPFSRRAGMIFPDFAAMFVRALAVTLSS